MLNAVALLSFILLYGACTGSLHHSLTHYIQTGNIRRFAMTVLVGWVLAASFTLLNNNYLPGGYCLSSVPARSVIVCFGLGAGLVLGTLMYESERILRHEEPRKRQAPGRAG